MRWNSTWRKRHETFWNFHPTSALLFTKVNYAYIKTNPINKVYQRDCWQTRDNLFYFRYPQQISRVKRTARYIIICGAILSLFIITILVHLPKTENKVYHIVTGTSRKGFQDGKIENLELIGLDLSNGSDVLLKILAEYYQKVGKTFLN